MDVLDFITLLIIMAAFFTAVNARYLKLPSTIGLMLLALGLSLFIIFGEIVFRTLKDLATDLMTEYDFSEVLFQVMLSFLLFAGALEMDLRSLRHESWTVLLLATFGVLISTFIVGTAVFYLLPFVGLPLEYNLCLLFGALISPTDPIAVLAMVKKTKGVSKNLESTIAGESLFNDGIGVVVFLTISSVVFVSAGHGHGGGEVSAWSVIKLFSIEVIGGLALGAAVGAFGLWALKIIPNEFTEIEVLVTLSMVLGGYSIAEVLGVSGVLAVVVMGLFVGNQGRSEELENIAGEYVYKFWHLMDEAMNAILFILIGLQIIVIQWKLEFFYASFIAIAVVLVARFIGVGIPISGIRLFRKLPPYTVRVLTWSGLRGGISVALALSLYETARQEGLNIELVNLITSMTYSVVLFSIVVQGLTIEKLFKKAMKARGTLPEGYDDPKSSEPESSESTESSSEEPKE